MKNRSAFGWVELVLGVLVILLGIYTLANPGTALVGVVIVYGIVALVSGIADIVLYFRLNKRTGFAPGTALLSGILNIIVGVLLLFNVGAGAWALSILFPIWFIVHCITRMANAGYMRAISGNGMYWFTVIVNIIGLILGVLLIFNPFASALSIAYFVAFYLLVTGVGSIANGISRIGSR